MNKLQRIKDEIDIVLDYWNGDCNELAMKDALYHYSDAFDDVKDSIDDLDQSNILDETWRYCDEYGLPECVGHVCGRVCRKCNS